MDIIIKALAIEIYSKFKSVFNISILNATIRFLSKKITYIIMIMRDNVLLIVNTYQSIAEPLKFFFVCQPVWNKKLLTSCTLRRYCCSNCSFDNAWWPCLWAVVWAVAQLVADFRTKVKYSIENWLRWWRNLIFCFRMLFSMATGILRCVSFFVPPMESMR